MPPQKDDNVPKPDAVAVDEIAVTSSSVGDKDGTDEENVDIAEQEEENVTVGEDAEREDDVNVKVYPSYFRNAEAFPKYVRWGIPAFLIGTFILLVNADIASGVSAHYFLVQNGVVVEERDLLNVSVISSVKKLWHNGSYPLAIFISIASVAWPYLKLFLALYSWMRTYKNPRRQEQFVEVIDALGKWSFVDIITLVEIMVAFRSSVVLAPGVTLEIVIEAQWGFYAFIAATMLSLLSTHVILHYHRQLHHPHCLTDKETESAETPTQSWGSAMQRKGGFSTKFMVVAMFAPLLAIGIYLAGVLVDTFEVTNTRGSTVLVDSYSIVSVGHSIPDASFDGSDFGTKFLQTMWFFLNVAMPIWCAFLFWILFVTPLSTRWMIRIFTMAEIAFAWSATEVLLVSTIFAVLQMPTFGGGLIAAHCTACFIVTTRILPDFAYLAVGAVLIVGVSVFLYRKAHCVLYKE